MANCFCPSGFGWPDEDGDDKDGSSFLAAPPPPPPPPLAAASAFQLYGYPYSCSSFSMPFEEREEAASPSKSHSQAEKRRRDRINAQLSTLRKLIPKSDKMDKAALLANVVEQVRDLKKKALEVSKIITIPTDFDEVTVDYYDLDHHHHQVPTTTIGGGSIFFFKASVCCDDRPELFAELHHALKGLKLTTVQADITSLGGRVKTFFVLCTSDDDDDGGSSSSSSSSISTLKQSIKVVLTRIATSPTTSTYRIKSKRQRFFLPPHHFS